LSSRAQAALSCSAAPIARTASVNRQASQIVAAAVDFAS
jgi:hypothetical protein